MRCSRTERARRCRRWSVVAALIATSAAVGAAGAQSSIGAIHGVVTDTTGRPMQGVTVRIQGLDLDRRVTSARGEFAFDNVPAGRRVLRLSMIAAYPHTDTIEIAAGRPIQRRYTMRVMPPPPPETLPPRYARGARPDTAPDDAERFDRVARMAGLPLLRQQRERSSRRELRFWWGGGIGIPENLIRLTIDGDRVQGEVIRWVIGTIPDREVSPSWRAFMDSVPNWLRSSFGCGQVATDTLQLPGAQAGYGDQLVAVCRSRYRREPDWRGLLRELEAHQVWTLPDVSELPAVANIISIDGGGVAVETWNGVRYHTYGVDTGVRIPLPGPETREADAIRRILLAFFNRTHADLR